MEKKRRPIKITELDVEPISSEEFAAILGSTEVEVIGGTSFCGCVFTRSDSNICEAS